MQINNWQDIQMKSKIINTTNGTVGKVMAISYGVNAPMIKKSCVIWDNKGNRVGEIVFAKVNMEDFKIWLPKALFERK